ncbi:1,4-dihydroxy-2-naphthoyl-CoA hydrolase [Chitinophaga terrae (ex Kim and Jung 2007)]|uniref:1,4-dihydroxy-2-naphthoyl-CoA hydrolase n=1 Tax=Chitinophaga terrae (ex Kim and Jung 2007) TaxID=408074 RepID=A0A1H3WYM5_9BACT|nr:hotdog fold thioesterase [Chitinophaga terrae (ex Kim and Jung 2007)]MDQ0106996.1 1,4-dihydroxy-2-naphthoyl-CoA hydrolase [Chitinophaga terrae (ex Kim and Jung 2007)]GEP90242.1 thioesterase [Chitinophaga terrae (ex Kim and Jung 2007)]SDZ92050.1 1,4-dihydroxy-2-naphthoyl-CoA hydrolase [Chitinophaga terrae (ex Kim and Jung 2007)]
MKTIWHSKDISLDQLNEHGKGTMGEWLGMEFTEIGPDYLRLMMPVDHRTIQPYGLLHGGASAALAETAGSIGSALIIDPAKQICVGMEINANHVRGVRSGYVHAMARPLHIGGSSHVWDIRITDDEHKLICVSRLTVAVRDKK